MGLYDRDYYRDDDEPGFGGFGRGTRSMVTTLILVNVGVYVAQMLAQSDRLTDFLSLHQQWFHAPWRAWELVTYGFSHDPQNLFHVALNMFVLWMFGMEVEGIYGRRSFLGMYLTAVIVAGLGWLVSENLSHPGRDANLLGASGAVTAVVVLFCCHFPLRPIYLFGILPLPAWVLGALYVVQDIVGLLAQSAHGGGPPVAYAAHVTGAVYGFFYSRTRFGLDRLVPGRWSFSLPRRQPKFKIHREEPPEENISQRVDEILEKISRQGEASLSDEERRTLQDASRKYQQRRR